jgi:hypothetical protein
MSDDHPTLVLCPHCKVMVDPSWGPCVWDPATRVIAWKQDPRARMLQREVNRLRARLDALGQRVADDGPPEGWNFQGER